MSQYEPAGASGSQQEEITGEERSWRQAPTGRSAERDTSDTRLRCSGWLRVLRNVVIAAGPRDRSRYAFRSGVRTWSPERGGNRGQEEN